MFDWLLHLDYSIFTQINSVWTAPWMDDFFPFVTDLHKTSAFKIVVPLFLISLFIFRRGLKNGLIILLFTLMSLGMSDLVGNHGFKKTIQRARPFNNPEIQAVQRSPAGGYSFVSNHATNNFAFATYVSSFFPASRIVVFTIAATIGYSRIYNGVHYPSDVVAGAILGTLIGILMSRACRKTLQKLNSSSEVNS